MTYNQMIDYAVDKYPGLKKALEEEARHKAQKKAEKKDTQAMSQNKKRGIRGIIQKNITDNLKKYRIGVFLSEEFENTNGDNKNSSQNAAKEDSKKKAFKEPHLIPKPIAKCVIDELMKSYLVKKYGYPKGKDGVQTSLKQKNPSKEYFRKMDDELRKILEKEGLDQIDDQDYLPFMEASDKDFSKNKYYAVSRLISIVLTDYLGFNVAELRKTLAKQVNHTFEGGLNVLVNNVANRSLEIINQLSDDKTKNGSKKIEYQDFYNKFEQLSIIPNEIKDMVCWETYRKIMEDLNKYSRDVRFYNLKVLLNGIFPDFMINERINDLFYCFFDFNKEEFLKDLEERAGFIHKNSSDSNDESLEGTTPFTIDDGYSEVTWRLKNPVGIYVFPKRAINTHDE